MADAAAWSAPATRYPAAEGPVVNADPTSVVRATRSDVHVGIFRGLRESRLGASLVDPNVSVEVGQGTEATEPFHLPVSGGVSNHPFGDITPAQDNFPASGGTWPRHLGLRAREQFAIARLLDNLLDMRRTAPSFIDVQLVRKLQRDLAQLRGRRPTFVRASITTSDRGASSVSRGSSSLCSRRSLRRRNGIT